MEHKDRQPKADARVWECCLLVLALLALAGAASSAAEESGAGGAPVLVTPGWTHAPTSAPAGAAAILAVSDSRSLDTPSHPGPGRTARRAECARPRLGAARAG